VAGVNRSLQGSPARQRKAKCPCSVFLRDLAWFASVFAIALVCVGTLKATPAKLKTLDRVTQIRVLTPNEAAHGFPVRVRGVVTYYDPALPDLFVQDSTGGIYVACQKPLDVRQGQLVEVTGISSPGPAPLRFEACYGNRENGRNGDAGYLVDTS
jgi:hypothetical protein